VDEVDAMTPDGKHGSWPARPFKQPRKIYAQRLLASATATVA
jgi:hypothetical protein